MRLYKQSTNFTPVSNVVLDDKRLSAKAKGVYAYLYSKPDSWDFAIERMTPFFSDGEKSIRSAIKELEAYGYLKRQKQQNGKMIYMIGYELEKLEKIPTEENPQPAQTADSQKGNQPKGQPAQTGGIYNTEDISNTDSMFISDDINNTTITGDPDFGSDIDTPVDEPPKKPMRQYGDPKIRAVIDAIKKKCTELGLIYDAEKDTEFAKHMLSAKFVAVASSFKYDNPIDFALSVIDASMKYDGQRWRYKANGPKVVYQKYSKILADYQFYKKKDEKDQPVIGAPAYTPIDKHIATFPPETQVALQKRLADKKAKVHRGWDSIQEINNYVKAKGLPTYPNQDLSDNDGDGSTIS